MTIRNWRHVDTVGGLRGDLKQPTKVEWPALKVAHPERLAHAGSMSGPARATKSDRRSDSRWLVFVVILCAALFVALILTLPNP